MEVGKFTLTTMQRRARLDLVRSTKVKFLGTKDKEAMSISRVDSQIKIRRRGRLGNGIRMIHRD